MRLGGSAGIASAVLRTTATGPAGFIARVLGDNRINSYFLNSSLNATRLVNCLTAQLTAATGGPGTYPPSPNPDGCRTMADSHEGLGISTVEFDALVGHLVAELTALGVATGDITAIGGVLTAAPVKADIIEDATNNGNLYQRIGGKPSILAVLGGLPAAGSNPAVPGFLARVLGDITLAPYFINPNAVRLTTCLERQVNDAVGGPEIYNDANAFEAALVTGTTVNQCQTMLASHENLMATVNGMTQGIRKAEFDALVGHLLAAVDDVGAAAGLTPAVIMELKDGLGAGLGPECENIVNSGTCAAPPPP